MAAILPKIKGSNNDPNNQYQFGRRALSILQTYSSDLQTQSTSVNLSARKQKKVPKDLFVSEMKTRNPN